MLYFVRPNFVCKLFQLIHLLSWWHWKWRSWTAQAGHILWISRTFRRFNWQEKLLFFASLPFLLFLISFFLSLSRQTLLTQDHRQTDIKWKCQLLSSGMYNSIWQLIAKPKFKEMCILHMVFLFCGHTTVSPVSVCLQTLHVQYLVVGVVCGKFLSHQIANLLCCNQVFLLA